MFLYLCTIFFSLLALPLFSQTLFSNDAFTISSDRVEEGKYTAFTLSDDEIRSDFAALFNQTIETKLICKFAINKKDNETPPFHDHVFLLKPENGSFVTPLLTFGKPSKPTDEEFEKAPHYVAHSKPFQVTFRLDMRHVLKAFKANGEYTSPAGATILAENFEGVYIAGGTEPLNWNFDNFSGDKKLTDKDGDGIYEGTLLFNVNPYRPLDDDGFAVWKLQNDISSFPDISTPFPLLNAIYRMTLEELILNKRNDGALNTGAKWEGVWTRDISYSTLLALAIAAPDACKISLLKKVKDGKIIQDTGTGGSWPVSSDRTTWALAAWEIYLVTGDKDLLIEAYEIIKNTIEQDRKALLGYFDELLRGESSFLDWREQSYPQWMEPADIYNSYCLGTNAVHYQTYEILTMISEELGFVTLPYSDYSAQLKTAMNNQLFDYRNGFYGQFLYGRNFPTLSPRSESLGEALCVLFDIKPASLSRSITSQMPVTTYGVPCFYPQIPDIPPYHNNAIWQFVTGFYTWAAAREKNRAAVEHGLASIFRSTALFLTNKENMTIDGKPVGTEINSDRQLWSIAATLAAYYRLFFGMHFTPEGIEFSPFIPKPYGGTYTLKNFQYREAEYTITVEGSGNTVAAFLLDGKPQEKAFLPADLKGKYSLIITLSEEEKLGDSINLVENTFSPPTPEIKLIENMLHWKLIPEAAYYNIYKNGSLLNKTEKTVYRIDRDKLYREYQVSAVSGEGCESFLSEPLEIKANSDSAIIQFDHFADILAFQNTEQDSGNGKDYLTLTQKMNTGISVDIPIPDEGIYSIRALYANGSGPVNTDNKAAIRTLLINDLLTEPLVMPQRGTGAWDDWGLSNTILIPLKRGTARFTLRFEEWNENMNGSINKALFKGLFITKVK